MVIDFDGLPNRIVDLPIPAGELTQPAGGPDGQLFYLRVGADRQVDAAALRLQDAQERDAAARRRRLHDRPRMARRCCYRQGTVVVDRRAEDEGRRGRGQAGDRSAWKCGSIRRPSGRRSSTRPGASTATTSTRPTSTAPTGRRCTTKYAAFLPDLAHRARSQSRHPVDVQRAGGRPHRTAAAATPAQKADTVPGGLLGADYEIDNGRYRFKKVYGGLNWNPELRAPLTEPGVNVKAGEYLLAVNGRDLRRAGQRLQPVREHRRQAHRDHRRAERRRHGIAHGAGRADRERGGAAQSRLGRGQPAQGRPRRRTAASPTSTCRTPPGPGHEYFKRYFFPQADRDGDHRRRALQRRRPGRRLLHRHPAASASSATGRHALRRRSADAGRRRSTGRR